LGGEWVVREWAEAAKWVSCGLGTHRPACRAQSPGLVCGAMCYGA
jgi:hypothetical protein